VIVVRTREHADGSGIVAAAGKTPHVMSVSK